MSLETVRTPGLVVRLVFEPDFETLYRTFDGENWGWSNDDKAAFVFERVKKAELPSLNSFETCAETHAEQLLARGERCHAVSAGRGCERERRLRSADFEARLDALVSREEGKTVQQVRSPAPRARRSRRHFSPQESYDITAHYLGEGGGD